MGLSYVSDSEPGIRRSRRAGGFSYRMPDGRRAPARHVRRIERMAVPPAWRDVWICRDPNGHLQATGRDARGRKQYLYHARWQHQRAASKFAKLEEFGARLPALRSSVEADLAKPGTPREKVVAGVVRVMERSFVRVGGQRYARDHRSYGASTLHGMHVRLSGASIRLRFRGKGGKRHDIQWDDPEVARLIRRCKKMPGRRLFSYDDGGDVRHVRPQDVNEYIAEAMEGPFSSKDLRTWGASTLMLGTLLERGPGPDPKQRMATLRAAVDHVAQRLHNTPTVCRRSYLHPVVAAAYYDGSLQERVKRPPRTPELWSEERRLVALLASYR